MTRLKKILNWVFAVLAITLIGLQFFNPSLKIPPVQPRHDLMATNPPPSEVAKLLHEACYDCHSNETKWPWYAHVAPVSLWIVHHIQQGREALNFSEWQQSKGSDATDRLDEIIRQVQRHKMPLPSYTWLGMHPEARLSEEQRGRILKWAEQEAQRLTDSGDGS